MYYLVHAVCWFLIAILDRIYFRVQVNGRENIPPEGGFILASNHLSLMDPSLLGFVVSPRRVSYVAKESIFRVPVVGWVVTQLGGFPVKRDQADIGSIRTGLQRIRLGRGLIIFPEGTRGVSGRKKKTRSGVGFLALKTRCPVIPVFIEGTDKALPAGKKWFQRHQVTVRIGGAVVFSPDDSYDRVAEKTMKAINNLSQSVESG